MNENLNFEELSEYYNSFQYTLGMSFKNKVDLNNLKFSLLSKMELISKKCL